VTTAVNTTYLFFILYSEDGDDNSPRKLGTYLPNYTTSYPIKPYNGNWFTFRKFRFTT